MEGESAKGSREDSDDKGVREGQDEEVDALGLGKRRQVIGQGYGPGKARQFIYYGIFVAAIIGLYIGATFAVSELDVAPEKETDQAPWAKADPQIPPTRFE